MRCNFWLWRKSLKKSALSLSYKQSAWSTDAHGPMAVLSDTLQQPSSSDILYIYGELKRHIINLIPLRFYFVSSSYILQGVHKAIFHSSNIIELLSHVFITHPKKLSPIKFSWTQNQIFIIVTSYPYHQNIITVYDSSPLD